MALLIHFIRTKLFWRNVLAYVLLLVVGFFMLNWWLRSYTQHGETVLVPDLRSFTLSEAEGQLTPIDLEYAVIDSAEFDPEYPRGAVVGQIPGAGHAVKRGRTIFLTVNPRGIQKVILPNLTDRSRRQAISYLETFGFQVGELEFVPDMARDVVVGVRYNGEEIKPGDALPKRAVIDLVLGNGLSDEKISVPWIQGLTLGEAEARLKELSLNVGALSYDETVDDSAQSRVYRQYPLPNPRPVIRLGMAVDLWLTEDSTKIPDDTLFTTEPDMLQHELVE